MADLAEKLEQTESSLAQNGRMGGLAMEGRKGKGSDGESQLSKATRDRYTVYFLPMHDSVSRLLITCLCLFALFVNTAQKSLWKRHMGSSRRFSRIVYLTNRSTHDAVG